MRYFLLTTRIAIKDFKRKIVFKLTSSLPTLPSYLKENTISTHLKYHLPRLCLNLFICALRMAPVSAFSSSFLARAGARAEFGRSGRDRPSSPRVCPHMALEGRKRLSLTASCVRI